MPRTMPLLGPCMGACASVPCGLCCVPATLSRWVARYFCVLRLSARVVAPLVVGACACVLVYIATVYFLLVHGVLFHTQLESAALAPIPLFLLLGIAYLWVSVIMSDPGYALPGEKTQRGAGAGAGAGAGLATRPDDSGTDAGSDGDDDGDGANDRGDARARYAPVDATATRAAAAEERQALEHAKRVAAARPCAVCKLDRGATIHHDRISNRCVHSFDHWCVFVMNGIGAGNKARFLMLLLYVTAGAAYAALAGWAALLQHYGTLPASLQGARMLAAMLRHGGLGAADVHMFTAAVAASCALLAFGTLLVWNFYLALLGGTQLDMLTLLAAGKWARLGCVVLPSRRLLGALVPSREAGRNLDLHLQPIGLSVRAMLWWSW